MLYKIRNIIHPMNKKDLNNKTLDIYEKIRNISLAITLIVMQIFYIFLNNHSFLLLNSIFADEKIKEFVQGLVLSASTYAVIYFLVLMIWQRIWISQNSDSCYLSGTWYHVFDRQIDSKENYVRAGFLTIKQNFYDISVEANNFNVFFDEETHTLTYDPKDYSHWNFALSELKENGEIYATFLKKKKYTNISSDSGVMNLFVQNIDKKNKVSELKGTFSDSGTSTVTGNISFFRCETASGKGSEFIKNAPDNWYKYIENQLKMKKQAAKP